MLTKDKIIIYQNRTPYLCTFLKSCMIDFVLNFPASLCIYIQILIYKQNNVAIPYLEPDSKPINEKISFKNKRNKYFFDELIVIMMTEKSYF